MMMTFVPQGRVKRPEPPGACCSPALLSERWPGVRLARQSACATPDRGQQWRDPSHAPGPALCWAGHLLLIRNGTVWVSRRAIAGAHSGQARRPTGQNNQTGLAAVVLGGGKRGIVQVALGIHKGERRQRGEEESSHSVFTKCRRLFPSRC